jgi:glycosyltransferase involved in cell wall biosynthesis
MKFIYLTAKKYPGKTADHFYIENLARAFETVLEKDFIFVACDTEQGAVPGVSLQSVSIPTYIKRSVFFFFWIPKFWRKSKKEAMTFFTNDQNLLVCLIFWKKVFRLPFTIMADWHMLSETWKDAFIARYADISFSTSLKLENAIRKLASVKIFTIYGGVDLESYDFEINKSQLRKQLGLPEKFLVGYVGLYKTMGMEKGISTMIESLARLPRDTAMVFVGGKEDEIEFYKEKAEAEHVLDRCLFLPIQNFENVVKYEKAMEALVIPYPDEPHFRNYGFPMKIYEYMASGVPIVYTKLGLLEEVVGDCAYGISPDSPQELATTLQMIQKTPEESRKMTQKALEKVKKCTWIERARNILLCGTM